MNNSALNMDNRGINKLNHNLYKSADGEIYYHRIKFSSEDEEVISQINPDVVWALGFDEELIKKHYLKSRRWLIKELKEVI
ncbi:hypothetical protein BMS3Abin04_01512 [bacterium BMS3Abin04]|nr:hypothetical protein BMS3Abin04_01512 [bacterium BMS3Abin04]